MKLKEYRELLKLDQRDVAEALATSCTNVSRWENGVIPRPDAMRRIQAWSKGAVTPADFYSVEAA